jgi:hypothetical protein
VFYLMKNVSKHNSWKEMTAFKQNQAESNLDDILEALDELKIPSSPLKIKDHIERKVLEKVTMEADRMYEQDEINKTERDKYIKKYGKTMTLRTIQKWLSKYTEFGYVGYINNGYHLIAKPASISYLTSISS